MSHHTNHPSSDASPQFHTRSGILTPASDASLNLGDGAIVGGKKRKRGGLAMEDLLKETFVIKPYPTTVNVRPRKLQPLMLLPRSKLPLSFLELNPSAKAIPHSRVFEGHVKILELEDRVGNQSTLVIARLEGTRTLFAVERESQHLYVVCQIGSWVSLPELQASATIVAPKPDATTNIERQTPFPHESTPAPVVAPKAKCDSRKREAIDALLKGRKGSKAPETLQQNPGGLISTSPVEEPPAAILDPVIEEEVAPPTGDEIFDNTRTFYLEALYLTNASLAYFTKGPLSRARAAFQPGNDAKLDQKDLIEFLNSLLFSTSLMEKKYRDAVPEYISLLDIQDSTDEAEKLKKQRKKKMKHGKNGLYPKEEILIKQWWVSHVQDFEIGAPGHTREKFTKARISQLRLRETQLQIIIILEIMALQAHAPPAQDQGAALPDVLPSIEVPPTEKKSKGKKSHNLPTLVDVHLDRLCIWQDMPFDSEHLRREASVALSREVGGFKQSTAGFNIDFCVDIIKPFFSSRLPEQCDEINQKLGGPVAAQESEPEARASPLPKTRARPGAATKRSVPKRNILLEELLAKEKQKKARSESQKPNLAMKGLMARTVNWGPTPPTLKRENSSALSLSSIPALNLGKRTAQQAGMDSDMNPKAKKRALEKAKVEEAMQEAISSIRKPNRELAGKSIAEIAEKRTATAAHPRKSKKPVHNPNFKKIQVPATPHHSRNRNRPTNNLPGQYNTYNNNPYCEDEQAISSSMPSVIPDSCFKLPPIKDTPKISIEDTPTRAKSRPTSASSDQGMLGVPAIDFNKEPPLSPLTSMNRPAGKLFTPLGKLAVSNNTARKVFGFATIERKGRTPNSSVSKTTIANPPTTSFEPTSESSIFETPIKKPTTIEKTTTHFEIQIMAPPPGSGSKPTNENEKNNTLKSVNTNAPKDNSDTVKPVEIKPLGIKGYGNTKRKDSDELYKSLGWEEDDYEI